jgi:protein-S-isoprenylcysteine O-methyltransferase Ste14
MTIDPPKVGSRGEAWVAAQVAIIVLTVLCGLRGPGWPRSTRVVRWPGSAVAALTGGWLFAAGALGLGRQLTPFPRPVAEGRLREDGAYGLVRHPIYGGVLLVVLAWCLLSSPLAFVPWGTAIPFLGAKSRREEAWLAEQHPEYAGYRERVRHRFVPFVW